MAQQSSAPGSAVEAAFLNDAEGSKTSLLDSIFGGSPARSVERRSFGRDAASLDPHRAAESRPEGFVPAAPKSLEEAGLTETEVEDLILKFLFDLEHNSDAMLAVLRVRREIERLHVAHVEAIEVDGRLSCYADAGQSIDLRSRPGGASVVRLGHTTFYQRARRKLRITDSAEIPLGLAASGLDE